MKKINAGALKIIAMVTMVIDHIGVLLNGVIPSSVVFAMTAVGRIAFPIFAFLIAEGFKHTGNIKKYILRVGIFALISEMPFDFLLSGRIYYTGRCNVLFTFLIALLVLYVCKYAMERGTKGRIICFFAIISGMLLAWYMKTDYSFKGVALIVIFYFAADNPYIKYGLGNIVMLLSGGLATLFTPLGFVPIYFYNGEKGKLNKWIAYFFYPLHLALLGIIGGILLGKYN